MTTLTPQENAALDGMRGVGDDGLASPAAGSPRSQCYAYVQVVYESGLTGPGMPDLNVSNPTDKRAIKGWWNSATAAGTAALPVATLPLRELEITRDLFRQYGTEIGSALLLAALPEAYAARWGARVLAATGQLQQQQQGNLRRRIRATAQFVVQVLAPSGDMTAAWTAPTGDAFRAVVGLRQFHQVLRAILLPIAGRPNSVLGPDNKVPLNQEDLLATQMTFVVSVFEVLEKFGIAWSQEEQQAFLTVWRHIGDGLGIQPLPAALASLEPVDVPHARALLAKLRERQWLPIKPFQPVGSTLPGTHIAAGTTTLAGQWDSLQAGRLLVRALLDELSGALTSERTQGWPLALMRQLAPSVVGDRLGLGANGLIFTALNGLPRRQVPVARFTRLTTPNPFQARVLRAMANTVTRQTVVAWLRSDEQPPFILPGLEQWASGLRAETLAPPPLV
jgi:hypothetical protein